MSTPTPLSSFLGGVGLSIPVHALLIFNGNIFGISGFLHRAVQGDLEGLCGVLGLISGGALVSWVENSGPSIIVGPGLLYLLVSGLFVGCGTRLSNGCTSGHMICGVSRFSLRSIVATCTFATTATITSGIVHSDLPPSTLPDWALNSSTKVLIAIQAVPVTFELFSYLFVPKSSASTEEEPKSNSRSFMFFMTGLQFALALRVSNLTDPVKVLSFLSLPFHPAFDPSLFYLAAGALPLSIALYRYCRGHESPIFGGTWSVPKGGRIDGKLLMGAALFGVGWGMAGVCPGPGLVNFGRALFSGSGIPLAATWLAGVAIGGLLTGI